MIPFAAALLSFLFPGLGQASLGYRDRAVIVALPTLAVLGAFALIMRSDPSLLFGPTPDQGLLTSLLILDLTLAVYHLWAVLDAYVLARKVRPDRLLLDYAPRRWVTILSVGVLVAGTVGVHAAAAEVSISWQHGLSCNTGATPCWFDISYPQCGSPFPDNAEFGIVGVNHGKVFSANPCLGVGDGPPELSWAGGVRAQLYANTGNPGPDLSTRWPNNQTSPRQCNTSAAPGADTADCAYDYGWNAAADSYGAAVSAYVAVGLAQAGATSTPSPNLWWLDVETVNSWREDDFSLNVAALHGAVDYLESVSTAGVGFYSTGYQWNQITGGTTDFAAYPSWVAGAGSAGQAVSICSATGFTGGRVALVQYQTGGFDADFPCQVSK
jgi:hypothetical protein